MTYDPYKPGRATQPARGAPVAPPTAGRRMGEKPAARPATPRLAAAEELFTEVPPAPPAPQRAQTTEEARRRFCERYLVDVLRPLLGEGVALPQTVDEWYGLAERVRDALEQPASAAPQVATWLAEALRLSAAKK